MCPLRIGAGHDPQRDESSGLSQTGFTYAEAGLAAPLVLDALAGGAALLAGFLWREGASRDPMMPLALFRSPRSVEPTSRFSSSSSP